MMKMMLMNTANMMSNLLSYMTTCRVTSSRHHPTLTLQVCKSQMINVLYRSSIAINTAGQSTVVPPSPILAKIYSGSSRKGMRLIKKCGENESVRLTPDENNSHGDT